MGGVDEAELKSLLISTHAADAVCKLMELWMPRAADLTPRFGLSRSEYVATLCLTYGHDVRRGGHRDYFSVRGGQRIRDTLDGLDAIGLTAARQILTDACGTFPSASVPPDPTDIEFFFEDCLQSVFTYLHELDRALNALLLDEFVLGFLRRNHDDVLVPERASPRTLKTSSRHPYR